jgi:hypothetical protein
VSDPKAAACGITSSTEKVPGLAGILSSKSLMVSFKSFKPGTGTEMSLKAIQIQPSGKGLP